MHRMGHWRSPALNPLINLKTTFLGTHHADIFTESEALPKPFDPNRGQKAWPMPIDRFIPHAGWARPARTCHS